MSDPLEEHFGYLSDKSKIRKFQAAIENAVSPGDIVVDLGCGSGILGLMALRAGAGKVFFVEEGAVIEMARRTVADAGYAHKAEYFQENSFHLALPEPADIVICDHIGYFGFDYGAFSVLADAQERFLKPGGTVFPSEVEVFLSLVESDACNTFTDRWRDGSVPGEFEWTASLAANSKHAIAAEPENIVSDPVSLARIALGEEVSDFVTWTTRLTCTRAATASGLLGWFESTLHDNTRMTNSPLAGDRIERAQAFLPFENPVSVSEGESINATIMVRHRDYIIAWAVEFPEQDLRIAHSTFSGLILDNKMLEHGRTDRVAKLNDRGRARKIVLGYCDGDRTVAEIDALVRRNHAELFPSPAARESFVRQVLAWDTDT